MVIENLVDFLFNKQYLSNVVLTSGHFDLVWLS